MESLNNAFKTLAEKMNLPTFFKSTTLIFNNLFLAIVAVVILIALLLVIFLVPGKKKKDKKSEPVAAPVEEPAKAEPAPEPQAEETVAAPAEEVVAEEAPAVVEPEEEAPAEESEPAVVEPEVIEPAPAETEVVAAKAEPVQEEKSQDKAPAKKDTGVAGKYEIVKRNGSYYFLLKANNGQLLLESTGYTTEAGAKGGIDTFKNAVEVGEFFIDPDKNGNYRFILRASARSQMLYIGESYSTRQSAESAVGSVKNFASRAIVKRVEEADVEDGSTVELTPLKESEHKAGGKYEIAERNGLFYFLLKANNGQLLLESPAFTTEAGAKSGIDTFKKATESGVYFIDEDKNGKFRFVLRAGVRVQVRYTGENYSTRQSAENSLNSVRAFAQNAVLK